MSQAEDPRRLDAGHQPTIEDIHELIGSATSAFALQLSERVRRLIAPLPAEHPVRVGERAIERLTWLGFRSDTPGSFIAPGEEGWRQHD